MTNLDIDGFVMGLQFDTSLITFSTTTGFIGKMDEIAFFPSILSRTTIASHAKDRQSVYHVGSRLPPGPLLREEDGLPEQPTYIDL